MALSFLFGGWAVVGEVKGIQMAERNGNGEAGNGPGHISVQSEPI